MVALAAGAGVSGHGTDAQCRVANGCRRQCTGCREQCPALEWLEPRHRRPTAGDARRRTTDPPSRIWRRSEMCVRQHEACRQARRGFAAVDGPSAADMRKLCWRCGGEVRVVPAVWSTPWRTSLRCAGRRVLQCPRRGHVDAVRNNCAHFNCDLDMRHGLFVSCPNFHGRPPPGPPLNRRRRQAQTNQISGVMRILSLALSTPGGRSTEWPLDDGSGYAPPPDFCGFKTKPRFCRRKVAGHYRPTHGLLGDTARRAC